MKKKITVLIPAYEAGIFIHETLNSIFSQDYTDFDVVCSVDLSMDNTADVCKKFHRHEKNFKKLVVQNKHLGWVENCNYLLKQVKTKYFCIIPHDDIILPNYLSTLKHKLDQNPDASVVYSDIKLFGNQNDVIFLDTLEGEKLERITNFLENYFSAFPFRGLVRKHLVKKNFNLINNQYSGYAADTIWMLKLALGGNMLRVEEPLYQKRIHNNSTHAKWANWSEEYKEKAWLQHCIECATLTLTSTKHTAIILPSLISRVCNSLNNMPISTYTHDQYNTLIAKFVYGLIRKKII